MPDWLWTVYSVVEVVVPLGMLPLLARMHRPSVAVAWLALLLVVPVLGMLAWGYFGLYRLRRERTRRAHLLRDMAPEWRLAEAAADGVPERWRPLERLVTRVGVPGVGGWPALGGNAVEMIAAPEALADRLVREIDEARESVHLLFYLFAPDEAGRRVGDALCRAARRGVSCRLLADAYASRFESSGDLFRDLAPELVRHGVKVRSLEPMNLLRRGLARLDLRNHRKLAVIDDAVAYAGSENLHDPDMGLEEGTWEQLGVRVAGPVAHQLALVFAEDWCLATDERLAPRGTLPAAQGDVMVQAMWWGPGERDPGYRRVFTSALGMATQRVAVVTPYFVPDSPLLVALQAASERGVAVELFVPRQSDKGYVDAAGRSLFDALLSSGVRILQHDEGILHTKCVLVDDEVTLLGSANLDQRSLYLDAQLMLVLYHPPFAADVGKLLDRYRAASRPIDPESWSQRPATRRTADAVAGLLAPLL